MIDVGNIFNISTLEIEKKLFELGDFDFITVTDRGKNLKQEEALRQLTSGTCREILYGGAAGGAKSWTGATWLTFMCECFPETKWFVGRESLSDLRNATLATFMKVFKAYGIEGWQYRDKDHYILFANGSRIDFVDLAFYPKDRMYERLGSFEYTGGWIEEAGEVNFGAYDVLKTRIGRHYNDRYNIRPTLFITCNPKKNWLYYEFFTPWKLKKLAAQRLFVQAFVQDNPAIELDYIEQLRSLNDKVKKERLLLGNWDYDDDPNALCAFDAIIDLFTNDHVKPNGYKTISTDLAMKGRDRFIVGVADGLVVNVAIDKETSTGKEIETDVKTQMVKNSIPHSRTITDSDGLGAYLESYLTGIKEFHGGGKAIDIKEFANIKSECGFKLAEVVNKRLMKIICTTEQRQRIIEELGVLKQQDVDADESRKRIIQKGIMKELLGRSPDYLDMLIMLMYFIIKPEKKGSISVPQ
jgi:phage terminase large subunit